MKRKLPTKVGGGSGSGGKPGPKASFSFPFVLKQHEQDSEESDEDELQQQEEGSHRDTPVALHTSGSESSASGSGSSASGSAEYSDSSQNDDEKEDAGGKKDKTLNQFDILNLTSKKVELPKKNVNSKLCRMSNAKFIRSGPEETTTSISQRIVDHTVPMKLRSFKLPTKTSDIDISKNKETAVIGLRPGERLHLVGSGAAAAAAGRAEALGHRFPLPLPPPPAAAAAAGAGAAAAAAAGGGRGGVCWRTFHSARYQGCLQIEAQGQKKEGEVKTIEDYAAPRNINEATELLLQSGFEVVIAIRSLLKKPGDALLTCKNDVHCLDQVDQEMSCQIHGVQMSLESVLGRGFWPVSINLSWESLATTLVGGAHEAGGAVFMVAGTKGVGKSTFCRYLANRLLRRYGPGTRTDEGGGGGTGEEERLGGQGPGVAFLDLDVGQPEAGPPGMLSLCLLKSPVLGPPSLCGLIDDALPSNHITKIGSNGTDEGGGTCPESGQRQILMRCYFGDTTSKTNPTLFISQVRQLLKCYQDYFGASSSFDSKIAPPLVINTDGWVRGMGLELLGAITDAARPKHLVKLWRPERPATQFELEPPPGCRVHRLEAAGPSHHHSSAVGGSGGGGRATAANQRDHRVLNYFLSGFSNLSDEAIKDGLEEVEVRGADIHDPRASIAKAFRLEPPIAVPWRALAVRPTGGAGALHPRDTLRALNGQLVALLRAQLPPPPPPPPPRRPAGGGGGGGGGAGGEGGRGRLLVLGRDPVAEALGLGLVRAVDPGRGLLYILTPVAPAVLEQCNTLALGGPSVASPPIVALIDPDQVSTPYVTAEAVSGPGARAHKARKNLQRSGHCS